MNSSKVKKYDKETGYHKLLHLIDVIADNASWDKIMKQLKRLYPSDANFFLSRYLWKKGEGEAEEAVRRSRA